MLNKLNKELDQARCEESKYFIIQLLASCFLFLMLFAMLEFFFAQKFGDLLGTLVTSSLVFMFQFQANSYRKRAKKVRQLLQYCFVNKESSIGWGKIAELWHTDRKGAQKTAELLHHKEKNMRLFDTMPDKSGLYLLGKKPNLSPQARNRAKKEANPHLKWMRTLLAQLPQGKAQELTQRLLQDTEKLLQAADRPEEIEGTANFLHTFLPMGTKLLYQYTTLPQQNLPLEKKIFHGLDLLHTAFLQKQGEYLEDNRTDIQAELTVLNQILQQNGLADGVNDLQSFMNKQENP